MVPCVEVPDRYRPRVDIPERITITVGYADETVRESCLRRLHAVGVDVGAVYLPVEVQAWLPVVLVREHITVTVAAGCDVSVSDERKVCGPGHWPFPQHVFALEVFAVWG
jgi:hypothetical protein